jgi:hypothetical protein
MAIISLELINTNGSASQLRKETKLRGAAAVKYAHIADHIKIRREDKECVELIA